MQRFRFRLESVLKWRALQLNLEETKLQTLFGERNRILAARVELEERRVEAERILTLDQVDGQQLAALDNHRAALDRDGKKNRGAESDCEQRIGAQRKAVAEAQRRVRLLEHLQKRRLDEWNVEASREIETLASETFLAKWVRERRA
jgi:hypothetical protein